MAFAPDPPAELPTAGNILAQIFRLVPQLLRSKVPRSELALAFTGDLQNLCALRCPARQTSMFTWLAYVLPLFCDMNSNTLVWIDHQEARIFEVAPDRRDFSSVSAPKHHVHRHPKGASPEHLHAGDVTHFFEDVARALEGASQILLVGPSTAKLQFLRHLGQHHPKLEAKVLGIETADHPSDGQLFAHAERYFGIPKPRL